MARDDRAPAGVFLVRAWIEEGSFRARVTVLDDVECGERVTVAAGSPAEVERRLRSWLGTLADEPGDAPVTDG